ncbi:hypothetical protein ES319_D05G099900v1 [Gossypium barbadense]|uniref:NOT2/NOT3/NOT5 C-terminal domain-containing protein n=2 Tax=Gossypium TaxID=3633 RepID=A0A5J5RFN8_GOSBA|nr:hypothetical protein ES319_D05G099900v1 [Gossypium barbadense]TYG67810.1 hypothetical protein ES288_D05G105300v1 [Gossypium darwinii]
MSGLLNSSINGSASNLPDSSGRSFGTSFSSQSGAASPVFHHTGTIQGLHNIHGSFNIPNMPGTLTSRNSTLSNVPTGGVQQPTGSLSGGRFASNNLPIALSQLSHGGSHGHSGVTNRGGLGVSPILGNAGPRITSSMGNIVGGGNIGRSMSSGGGLSVPGLASRLNLSANSGSGSLSLQGQNRLMSSMLPQGSPQLTSRPNSSGGPQGQLGSLRKQGLTPIVQQNQEFSIQNEDFPALPGFKGGNADYAMDLHQKEQLHDNTISMMQSQQFSMGRSGAFNLGGSYSSHRPQQQQHAPSASSSGVSFASVNNQDPLHLHGSDIFPSSHSGYHTQNSGPPGIGLRPLNSSNTVSGMGYDQLIQQYQQHQNQSPFRLQQMSAVNQSFREPGLKSTQAAQSDSDPFGLLGLQSVIKMTNPDLTSLALGIDLTTLGLNLNSSENLHKTFGSPWSDEPAKGDPEFTVPQCYYAKQPPALHQGYFSKFTVDALFYIFYSMPKDEAQLYAANELYNRGWFYHKEFRFWFMRVPNVEPLVKTNTYERGSYHYFDPNSFEIIRKDNFVVHYELLEKRPSLPQH